MYSRALERHMENGGTRQGLSQVPRLLITLAVPRWHLGRPRGRGRTLSTCVWFCPAESQPAQGSSEEAPDGDFREPPSSLD